MKIIDIRLYPVTLTVKPEFYIVSSAGPHAISRYVMLAIHTDEGLVGWGEANVVPAWSGENNGGAKALIEDYFAPVLKGRDPEDHQAIMKEIDFLAWENPFTKAAVEMALLDLVGKKRKKPIYELLGGSKNGLELPIKFVIGLREPEESAKIAADKVKEGFTAIKLKVGPDPEKDLLRVRLVREAVGPNIRMNVDVNGGWTVEQSIREINRYEPYNLEYVEQPTPRWDIEGLAKVKAGVKLPIMADEAVFTSWQAEQVIAKKAADLISIYPGKNGGLLNSQAICKMAEAAGIVCHLGSNLEWEIGTAAMCHLAAACANVKVDKYPGDILGPLYYSIKLQKTPIRYGNGRVSVPNGPGLGLDIDEKEFNPILSR